MGLRKWQREPPPSHLAAAEGTGQEAMRSRAEPAGPGPLSGLRCRALSPSPHQLENNAKGLVCW